MSGSGFTGPLTEGDEEESLSPEACYECKVNGGGKNGRHKRSARGDDLQQVPLAGDEHQQVKQFSPGFTGATSVFPLQRSAVSMASVDTQDAIPINISLASLLNKEPLLELLPALQPLENHVRYVITHGDANEHFRLLERRDGKSVLRLGKRPPPPGSYRLEIASLRLFGPRRLHQLERQHDNDYLQGEIGGALRIKLNVHVH